jgi:hypothetical protein
VFVLGCDVFCIYTYIYLSQYAIFGWRNVLSFLCNTISLTNNKLIDFLALMFIWNFFCTHVNNEMQCNWNKNSALCLLKPFHRRLPHVHAMETKNSALFFYVETISRKVGCPICTCMSHVNYYLYTRIMLSICTHKISVSLLFQM